MRVNLHFLDFFILSFFFGLAKADFGDVDLETLKSLTSGVYIECKIDKMCAWMTEPYLESIDIREEDVPMLTFIDSSDPECQARDLGALEGMPEDWHFWLWCSREQTEEEHANEEPELDENGEPIPEDGLSHYTCGTKTIIHQGEPGDEITSAWQIEPHIQHSNNISTSDPFHMRQITLPIECEWPTTAPGDDPMGFNFARSGGPSYFKTVSNVDLTVEIQLFKDAQFTDPYGEKPQFVLQGEKEIFISVKFVQQVPNDVAMHLVHLWASPVASSSQDVYFAWVMGSCEQHSKVKMLSSPSEQEIRVSLPVFMFEDSDEVFFHAIVKACRANECPAGCTGTSTWAGFNGDRQVLSRSRLRRSSPGDSSLLSIGPILLVEKNSGNLLNAMFLVCSSCTLVYLLLMNARMSYLCA